MKIIGLTGKKQHGKDTVCKTLQFVLAPKQVVRAAFADELKQEVADALGIKIEDIDRNKVLYRPILQWWGTEWRRGMFSDDYWIRKMRNVLDRAATWADFVVVTDCRFPNEADMVKLRGGSILRVVRKFPEGVITDCALRIPDNHPSETAMDSYPVDWTIEATNLAQLHFGVINFCQRHLTHKFPQQ